MVSYCIQTVCPVAGEREGLGKDEINMSRLYSKNVTIDGRRTSLRLEEEMWAALDDICQAENISLHDLCSRIEKARDAGSRTSTIRAFVVMYFRAKANGESPNWQIAELGN